MENGKICRLRWSLLHCTRVARWPGACNMRLSQCPAHSCYISFILFVERFARGWVCAWDTKDRSQEQIRHYPSLRCPLRARECHTFLANRVDRWFSLVVNMLKNLVEFWRPTEGDTCTFGTYFSWIEILKCTFVNFLTIPTFRNR